MAGKFISIEEAARVLGVSPDEVNRLVDRKKLFPMRDGGALKFKIDEIERVAAALGDDTSHSGSLSLDLDTPATDLDLPATDDLAIGDAIEIGDASAGGITNAGSQTFARSGAAGDPGGISGLAFDDDDSTSDSGDLALESVIGASSPSLARSGVGSEAVAGSSPGSEPLALDLSGIVAGTGSNVVPGSRATGGPGNASTPSGSGFGIPADSGLSLEDGAVAVSGIDLDAGLAPGSGVSDTGGALAGDAFDLGADTGDDDSASVVISAEEAGDSSFFGQVNEDSVSASFGDSSVMDGASSSMLGEPFAEQATEMTFSGWQIAGLTCCVLMLLTGAFIMYDLAWTIRQPQGSAGSAPLLNALSNVFGWRR